MSDVPKSTGQLRIPFYYHECEHGHRLVYTWTAPCSICVVENKEQKTIFMGHVMVRIDKEGFLKTRSPLRVR